MLLLEAAPPVEAMEPVERERGLNCECGSDEMKAQPSSSSCTPSNVPSPGGLFAFCFYNNNNRKVCVMCCHRNEMMTRMIRRVGMVNGEGIGEQGV